MFNFAAKTLKVTNGIKFMFIYFLSQLGGKKKKNPRVLTKSVDVHEIKMRMKLKCAAAAYSCIIISSRLPLKHSSLTGYLQTNFDKIQPGFSSNRSVVVTHDGKNGIDESNLINIKTKTNPSVRRAKQLLINIHLCLPLGILLEIKLLAVHLYTFH